MAVRLTARDRRALKALAIALMIAGIWLGHGFLASNRISPTTIEALEQRYLLERERAARRPAIEQGKREVARSARLLERRLLTAESPALAQAEIRSLAASLLEAEGIAAPRSAFGRVSEDHGLYVGVPLDLEFTCATEQLVRFMVALANAGPILATRTIDIRDDGGTQDGIRVRLTVEGYLRNDRAAQSPLEAGVDGG